MREHIGPKMDKVVKRAVAALRAAPQPPDAVSADAEYALANIVNGLICIMQEGGKTAPMAANALDEVKSLRATISAPAVTTEGEPVAWLCKDLALGNGVFQAITDKERAEVRQRYPNGWEVIPLYAALPAAKAAGRTDREGGFNAARMYAPDEFKPSGGVRAAVIEECAKICDRWIASKNLHEHLAATDIAKAIRALSQSPATDAAARREEIARIVFDLLPGDIVWEDHTASHAFPFEIADAIIASGLDSGRKA